MESNLSVANLLSEESTIDPSSTLPSFLEMKLVHETAQAGRKALHSSIEAVAEKCEHLIRYYPHGSFRQKLVKSLSYIFRRYQDELQMTVHYIIERNYLLSDANSLLSESFYGLKRSKLSREGKINPMNTSDGIRAALIISLWPFIKSRGDRYYENERSRRNSNESLSDPSRSGYLLEKIQSMFIHLYPYLHLFHDGVKIGYQIAYLIGKSVYFDPSLHLLGLVVRRITTKDMNQGEKVQQEKSTLTTIEMKIPRQVVLRLKKAAAIGISSALIIGWLESLRQHLIRSRRMLILSNNGSIEDEGLSVGNKASEMLAPPAPMPSPTAIADGRIELPGNKSLCPICRQNRVNPVASSSGHVFCHKCLVLHIRENGPKCPITLVHCDRPQIIQLYEPGNIKNSDNPCL